MGFFSFITKPFKKAIDWVVDLFVPDVPQPEQPKVDNTAYSTTVNRRGGDYSLPLLYQGKTGGSLNQQKLGAIEAYVSTGGDNNRYLYVTYVLSMNSLNYIRVKTTFQFLQEAHIAIWNDHTRWGDYTFNLFKDSDNNTYNWLFHRMKPMQYGESTAARAASTPSWHPDKNLYPGLEVIKFRAEYPRKTGFSREYYQKPNFEFFVTASDYSHIDRSSAVLRSCPNIQAIYDYLLNPTYGAGLNADDIDNPSFISIATMYNAVKSIRYGTPYVINTDQSIATNLRNLLLHNSCALIYENGKFVLRLDPNAIYYTTATNSSYTYSLNTWLGYADISTHTVDQKNIIGGVSFNTTPNSELPYQYVYSFFDTETRERSVPSNPNSINHILQQSLGAQNRPTPKIDNIKRFTVNASDPNMDFKYYEARIGNTINLSLSPEFANIRVYDIIRVTYAPANLSDDQFIVINMQRNSDMTIDITAKQYLGDTTLYTAFPVADIKRIVSEQNIDFKKTRLLMPAGLGINNTQIDEFIPNYRVPTITNLVVDSNTSMFRKDVNGNWLPTIRIRFDELFEPNINHILFTVTSPNRETHIYPSTTAPYGEFKLSGGFLKSGLTYTVELTVVSDLGTVGNSVSATVYIPYADGYTSIRKEFDINNTTPFGQIIDSSGATNLVEDGGLKWCQLTVPPESGIGCSLGSDPAHDLYDSWDAWEDEGAPYERSWISEHPLTGCLGVNVDAYYEETSSNQRIYIKANESFTVSGSIDARVVGYEDNDTSSGNPFARASIGWKVYRVSDNSLRATYAPPTFISSNVATPSPKVGPFEVDCYALPYFYVYGANTSGCDQLCLRGYELDVYKTWSKTVQGIDTSTLSGSVGARVLDIRSYLRDNTGVLFTNSLISTDNVIITANVAETKNVVGRVINNNNTGTVNVVDVATNTSTDAIIDVTIIGIPMVYSIRDSNGNYTTIYKLIDQ